jgi:2-iminobutanoate/2-iminopropanoate deaminase
MTRAAVRTSDAPTPAGPYSQGIISGQIIALAGQGGFDPETNELVGPDFADEAHRTFQNLMAVLREAGSGPESIIRMGVYLSHPDLFAEMNTIYQQYMVEPYPVRTTIYVVLPGAMRIEVDALATRL